MVVTLLWANAGWFALCLTYLATLEILHRMPLFGSHTLQHSADLWLPTACKGSPGPPEQRIHRAMHVVVNAPKPTKMGKWEGDVWIVPFSLRWSVRFNSWVDRCLDSESNDSWRKLPESVWHCLIWSFQWFWKADNFVSEEDAWEWNTVSDVMWQRNTGRSGSFRASVHPALSCLLTPNAQPSYFLYLLFPP